MQIDFKESLNDFISFLDSNKKWVLATSFNDHVTARMISTINREHIIYFQTSKSLVKYNQLVNNNRIALCIGNYQVEALAKELGHPNENRFFMELYEKHHPSSFRRYSHLKDETVFEVTPVTITVWKYIESVPFRDIILVNNKTAERIEYETVD